jgi:hypothetical protein
MQIVTLLGKQSQDLLLVFPEFGGLEDHDVWRVSKPHVYDAL